MIRERYLISKNDLDKVNNLIESIEVLRCRMTEQEAIKEVKRWTNILMSAGSKCVSETAEAQDMAIKALEEIQQYRAIGTIDECREAVEKQKAKKPKEYEDKFYGCPTCGNILLHKWEKYPTKLMDKKNGLPYCFGCGQKLDWSDEK